ncbi:Mur ligase family protein [Brachybacterium sp. AOP43-C2-M15]|uniref:Mur ligase family protein n=1 Tax=Brachybacterium sp. AOP43-C2-M15 TaxID=3457661 RepID=UPI004034B971
MVHPVSPPVGRPLTTAVTGTNGKTSVATATLQLLRAAGLPAAGYDSTGIHDVHGTLHEARPRRSPDYLPEMIARQVREGAEAISLEAFVGILKDGLFERVPVDVAVCTGLERDHLDVHGSLESYWGAKLSLFGRHLRADGVAVMAVDCARGDLVRAEVARRGARLVTVGEGGDVRFVAADGGAVDRGAADRGAADRGAVLGGVPGRLFVGAQSFEVVLPVRHAVAVTNLLLAATAVIALGMAPGTVAAALARVSPPPGRLETIGRRGGVTAVVDTAHNPAALRTALAAMRAETGGRLLVVFGAGGERDRAKRPEMGQIAAELADVVVLTDDNPRREPPQRIRAEVRSGCPDCLEIPNRADAVRAALLIAGPGDTVLVAGKGDETVQLVGTERVPYDDREVIRAALGEGAGPAEAAEA